MVSYYLGQMELSLMPNCCSELLLEAGGVGFEAPFVIVNLCSTLSCPNSTGCNPILSVSGVQPKEFL